MTYAAIQKMRLEHGARCSDPPIKEKKIQFEWQLNKRKEHEVVEHPSEPFVVAKINMVPKNKSLIGDNR